MKVFKFGGASVKDADGVKNLANILRHFPGEKILVVVSAMDKTTNALEELTHAYFQQRSDVQYILEKIKKFHFDICLSLFPDFYKTVLYNRLNNIFVEIQWMLEEKQERNFDYNYDQIVSSGEMLSTLIVSEWLIADGIQNTWLDVRDCIFTDNNFREAGLNKEITSKAIARVVSPLMKEIGSIVVTQGFIGCTSENFTTTLGREGSDYTAAIFGSMMDAEEVIIWKDVPGIKNADPKQFSPTVKFEQLSYTDAIELTFYGATVLHPKTIKPLQNKNIPLQVRSFVQPSEAGTLIGKGTQTVPLVPSFIFKSNQILVSISAKDYSFIAENHLSDIFKMFSGNKIKINLMQNSALSFSVCADFNESRTDELIRELSDAGYWAKYNSGLDLVTVRHYTQQAIDTVTAGKEILLEQRSRHSVQYVIRSIR